MSSKSNTEKLKAVNPALTIWDDDRQPEMLLAGLSLADTLRNKKPEFEAPEKRRTLDDMRRLSAHIKKVPVYAKK